MTEFTVECFQIAIQVSAADVSVTDVCSRVDVCKLLDVTMSYGDVASRLETEGLSVHMQGDGITAAVIEVVYRQA